MPERSFDASVRYRARLPDDPPPVLSDRAPLHDRLCLLEVRSPGSTGSTSCAGRGRCRLVGRTTGSEDPQAGDERHESTARRCLATWSGDRGSHGERSGRTAATGDRRPSRSLRIASTALVRTSLPSDSDEATLEAIAASGKPLALSEAMDEGGGEGRSAIERIGL